MKFGTRVLRTNHPEMTNDYGSLNVIVTKDQMFELKIKDVNMTRRKWVYSV